MSHLSQGLQRKKERKKKKGKEEEEVENEGGLEKVVD